MLGGHIHLFPQKLKWRLISFKVQYKQKFQESIGHSGIAQGTGATFKFEPIDKLTPPHER